MGKAYLVWSKVPYNFLRFLTKFWFPRQIFMKFPITNLMEISPVDDAWTHADRRAGGRTDGHDTANSRSSRLWERA